MVGKQAAGQEKDHNGEVRSGPTNHKSLRSSRHSRLNNYPLKNSMSTPQVLLNGAEIEHNSDDGILEEQTKGTPLDRTIDRIGMG